MTRECRGQLNDYLDLSLLTFSYDAMSLEGRLFLYGHVFDYIIIQKKKQKSVDFSFNCNSCFDAFIKYFYTKSTMVFI